MISVLKRNEWGQMRAIKNRKERVHTEDTEEEHRGRREEGGNPKRESSIHVNESRTSPS